MEEIEIDDDAPITVRDMNGFSGIEVGDEVWENRSPYPMTKGKIIGIFSFPGEEQFCHIELANKPCVIRFRNEIIPVRNEIIPVRNEIIPV